MKIADRQSLPFLTDAERARLLSLLSTVGSRTLLNVLLDMDRRNADGSMLIEVLLERLEPDASDPGRRRAAGDDYAPVMPI